MQLFEDQAEFVRQAASSRCAKGRFEACWELRPAFSKTVVVSYITSRRSLRQGGSCWFLVHRRTCYMNKSIVLESQR